MTPPGPLQGFSPCAGALEKAKVHASTGTCPAAPPAAWFPSQEHPDSERALHALLTLNVLFPLPVPSSSTRQTALRPESPSRPSGRGGRLGSCCEDCLRVWLPPGRIPPRWTVCSRPSPYPALFFFVARPASSESVQLLINLVSPPRMWVQLEKGPILFY